MANHKLVLGHGQNAELALGPNHHDFGQDNGLGLGYGHDHDHELVLGQSHDESTTTWRHRVGCSGTAGTGESRREERRRVENGPGLAARAGQNSLWSSAGGWS